jgi:hypothetical protein
MNEKRKRRRIEVTWLLRIPNPQGGQIQSRTMNVSASGIMFQSPQSYKRNDVFPIEMDVSNGCTLRVVVRIAREIPGSPRVHTYGAQFLKFADDGQKVLEETLVVISQRQAGDRLNSRIASQSPVASAPPHSAQPEPSSLDDRRWGPRSHDDIHSAVGNH